MSLTSCLFVAGNLPREFLSRDLIHLINDIFWDLQRFLRFKNETQAKKEIVIIHIIQIISIILIPIILMISIILQVRVELGIPDHVWQEKRVTIAASIDGLGDKVKPELRAA
jgi:hypothetical protein